MKVNRNEGILSEKEYKAQEFQRSNQLMRHVEAEDFDNLIDLALDMRDYEWAKQLHRDKIRHIKRKKKLEERRRKRRNK